MFWRHCFSYTIFMFMIYSLSVLTFALSKLLMQAVINSTITPNMTFTKTSQKFGQWSDVRANTVYGLGFATEAELNKVKYIDIIFSQSYLRVKATSLIKSIFFIVY